VVPFFVTKKQQSNSGCLEAGVAANWALCAVVLLRQDLCGWGELNGYHPESGGGHLLEAGGARVQLHC